MAKLEFSWMKLLVITAFLAALLMLGVLVAAPTSAVQAEEAPQGGVADACKACHTEVYDHWVNSRHGAEQTNCFACHKLDEGEGAHPQVSYLNLSEAETCDTCHADIKAEWMTSKHGERGMGCITCHEPHSQQQKLVGENKSTCENCHRTQVDVAHDSTHGAAGLTCASCHLGPEVGHTFISEISTCQTCHSNIHEANSLIRGASITPVADDSVKPRVVDPSEASERGGINLPVWLFFVVGIIIGGGGVWVLIERELDINGSNGNGKESQENEDEAESQG